VVQLQCGASNQAKHDRKQEEEARRNMQKEKARRYQELIKFNGMVDILSG